MKNTEVFGFKYFYLLILLVLAYNVTAEPVKCSLHDSACLTTQSQNALQKLIHGIPELGINSLKQLVLEPFKVELPYLMYEWKEVNVSGLENAIIDNVSVDMDFKTMRVLFHTTLYFETYHSSDGIIFSVARTLGKGPAVITLKNVEVEMLFVFDIVKKVDGNDYMDLKNYYYGITPAGGVHFDFNFYDGDKGKSDKINDLLNTNWRTVMANFGGYFNRKMTDKIFAAMKVFMQRRPLKDIFLYP